MGKSEQSFSPDGQTLLLNTYVTRSTNDYNLYPQRTDGSMPALIEQGAGISFSTGSRWVLALDPTSLQHLRVIPTGVGESPAAKTAMLALRHPIITQDGVYVLYVVQRIFSTLFVANGIQ